jgi:hypothetical protein
MLSVFSDSPSGPAQSNPVISSSTLDGTRERKRRNKGAPQSEFYTDSLRSAIRRRSSRGNSSLSLLAHAIADNKNVLFITGAGLSVKSGIKPFRGHDGLWEDVLWRCVVIYI